MIPQHRSQRMRTLAIAVLILGLVLLAIGIVYYTVPANKLPSILGHIANVTKHRTKRGLAAVVVGVVCLAGAGLAFMRSRPR